MKAEEFMAKSSPAISLIDHSKDVERIASGLGEPALKLLSLLHDVGKVSPSFQRKLGNERFSDIDPRFQLDVPHNILSLFYIDKRRLYETFAQDSRLILSAIAFHHYRESMGQYLLRPGKLAVAAKEMKAHEAEINEALSGLDREFGLGGLLKIDSQMIESIIGGASLLDMDILIPPYRLDFSIIRQVKSIGATRRLVTLSGFLKYSDHLASFLEDAGQRDFKIPEIPDRYPAVLLQMKNSGIPDSDNWQKRKMTTGNTILLAGTGSGKSLFALMWAGNRQMIFTLPLRAAVNAMYGNVSKILGSDTTGLLHSDANLQTDRNDEELNGFTLDLARQLSLPNIITTGDQIFPSALKYPGYDRIYAIASRSAVVIDEVQAYSPVASAVVVKLLEDISAMGGKFLLMTATLPLHIKEEIEARCTLNGGFEFVDMYGELFGGTRKHRIAVVGKPLTESVPEILARLGEGKKVLVIANTVKRAQEIYQKLKDENGDTKESIRLLHSRLTMEDRMEKEKEVLEKFPNSLEGEPGILVSTQVVEASLDLSFDYLYTDISPIDSLVQRMGRVLRHIREPFEYKGSANVIIHVAQNKGKIANTEVYNNSLVESTLKALAKSAGVDNFIPELGEMYTIEEPLTEEDKKELIETVFSSLKGSDYLNEFEEALKILESGWLSDRKEEARRIFRDISQTAVIPETRLNEAVKSIREMIGMADWKGFKKNIVAKFVVNVSQNSLWKREKTELVKLLERSFGISDRKLLRYAKGIYVVKGFTYDRELGLK
ncbi:putative CRISPR-associated helicase Cas3 [Mesotoga infera]|uniref:Putative CRISPR-associated helicase Cas3 n=1 Tax=Mesotoga infera TaxID=1236046 RepID=A0A7Z7LG05_9BACT|nr:CRISPR-associated helicase Cas3' [Mesotoga infera]NLI08093.1 CRISPR-associated helicase Cas3' [Thermotogaceae bacterium]SSC12702.1 putative CRISPR-associated helicase Cas3 [Mesotoga infera]